MGGDVALSVVMPARDAAPTIEHQLAALADQELGEPWELVVVVDPRTSDDTVTIAHSWVARLPALSVVMAGGPGASRCRNEGVANSAGAAVAFCDADDVVSKRWLAGLRDALQDAELATGPIELARLNPPRLYSWRRSAGWAGPLPRWLGFLAPVMACNMAVRRETFNSVEGFDESLSTGEDFDFAWRAQLSGATVGFSEDATVHRRLRRGWPSFRTSIAYGASDVVLYRRFADRGLPRRLPLGLARVVGVVAATPLLAVRKYRYGWLHLAGVEIGRIAGSVRERVLYL
jgi:glycosyltransferase involved in cell wall biosynthesis